VLSDPLATVELGSNIIYANETLRNNMSITDPNMQAHHVIPYSQRNHPLVQLAAQAGWDINGLYNGIGLPDNDILGVEMGLIYHSGNHPQYNTDVTELLDAYYTVARDKHWTPADAANALLGIIQGLTYTIRNTEPRRLE